MKSFKVSELGLKKTRGRIAMLDILVKNQKPLRVSEIIEKLKTAGVSINEATVYRILEALIAKNIVIKLVSPNANGAMYELFKSDHHHFTCDNCGAIKEIMNCSLEPIIKKISHRSHLLIKSHTLEFSGLCAGCQ